MKRTIIKIDEEKCTGCGLCVPACVEGALLVIDGKAKLVSDKFCDGLGACLGKCPTEALTVEVREAEEFDEEAAQTHARTAHINEQACPSTQIMAFPSASEKKVTTVVASPRIDSLLSQWPIQLSLVPPNATFIKDADLIIAADCVGFAYPNFHLDFLKGRKLIIGCPKLDDAQFYRKKLKAMFKEFQPRSVTVVNMEVPCCFGLFHIVKEALAHADSNIPLRQEIVDVKGNRISARQE